MKKFTFLMALVLGFAFNAMALNPYAYNVSITPNADQTVMTLSFSLNAQATAVNGVLYKDGVKLGSMPLTSELPLVPAGTYDNIAIPVATALGANPEPGVYTFALEVVGTSPEVPTQDSRAYSFYSSHGVAVDVDPASANFGRIILAEGMNVVKTKTGYVSAGATQGPGIYAFRPDFTTDSVCHNGGIAHHDNVALGKTAYNPNRLRISEDGRIFATAWDDGGVAVYELSADLNTWTPVVAGTQDATTLKYYNADSSFYANPNISIDVRGTGENLKLLLYSADYVNAQAYSPVGFRLDEYALGANATFTGTPTNIAKMTGKYGVTYTNTTVVYDPDGNGYWFAASRAASSAAAPALMHFDLTRDTVDYMCPDGAGFYGGGGVVVKGDKLFVGIDRTSASVGNIGMFTIGHDENGNVTLSDKVTIVANQIGRNMNDFAFDYAGNMFVVGSSNEKIIAYAMPYSGTVETPIYGFSYTVDAPAAETVLSDTLTFSTDAGFGAITVTTAGASTTGDDYEFNKGGVTVTGTYGYIYSKKHTVYKNGTMVVTAGSAIDSIKITYNKSCYPFAEAVAGGSTTAKTEAIVTTTYVPAANTGTVTLTNASAGKTELREIIVFYQPASVTPPTPAEPEIIWSDFLGDGAGAGAYSNIYKYGHLEDQTAISYVNIQHPGFASADGIYLTAPAAIDACSLAGYDIQGGGICVHLSNFTAQVTEFTITCGTNVYTCYVWNENGTNVSTAIETVETVKAVKFFRGGQIYIQKGDAVYTISGVRVE